MNNQVEIRDSVLDHILEEFGQWEDYTPEDITGGVAQAVDIIFNAYKVSDVESEHYFIQAKVALNEQPE